ncbi:MAG: RHS repeat-associated core domain-containing protein [Spirochaetaceae bacterium]|nr:RHS repeat-associated core domain-containing protein [Spirochaetaceae bacterium]
MTDKNGNIVWQDDFTPFGEETGASGFLERDGFYTGKKIDSDTGLYYFNARWYDPALGRFITEDPIKDGTNWFAYVSNNPLIYTDPTGLEKLKNIILTFYRHTSSSSSRGESNIYGGDKAADSLTGLDYAILKNTETGESIRIDGIQTYSNHDGSDANPDGFPETNTIKEGSDITYKVRESNKTTGFSLALGNAETSGEGMTDSDGYTEGGDLPQTAHGNGEADSGRDYYGTILSGGCFVIPKEGAEMMKETLEEWGAKVDDTFDGSIERDPESEDL